MKKVALFVASMAFATPIVTTPVSAGIEPFLGEVMLFGPNFCPRGWTAANGQLLAISQHQALFSLLGTNYGGDGRTTFALPDLQGRVPVGVGQGDGLRNYNEGDRGGVEANGTNVTLSHHAHQDATSSVFVAGHAEEGQIINMQPYIGMRYCIALEGVYPSRS